MEPKGSKKRAKKMGPKREPWGALQVMGVEEENRLPVWTENIPTVRTRPSEGATLGMDLARKMAQENRMVNYVKS